MFAFSSMIKFCLLTKLKGNGRDFNSQFYTTPDMFYCPLFRSYLNANWVRQITFGLISHTFLCNVIQCMGSLKIRMGMKYLKGNTGYRLRKKMMDLWLRHSNFGMYVLYFPGCVTTLSSMRWGSSYVALEGSESALPTIANWSETDHFRTGMHQLASYTAVSISWLDLLIRMIIICQMTKNVLEDLELSSTSLRCTAV